ncbi:hypothetical protein JCM6882_003270 [Rhodosporidiobolus microsporus]
MREHVPMPLLPSIGYNALPSSPLPSPMPRDLSASDGGTSCLDSPSREEFVMHGGPDARAGRIEALAAAADAQILHKTLRSVDRRQLRYSAVLLVVFLLIFLRPFSSASTSSLPSTFSSSYWRASANHSPLTLHPTLVGPRPSTAPDGKPLYTQCTADELLLAVKNTVVREDGASRFPNATKQESVEIKPLVWSFDLADVPNQRGGMNSCGVPHVYSAEEACELLAAFGGVVHAGDSFSRHIEHALLNILRDRNDGGVTDYATTDDCREEQGFAESKECRLRVPIDTSEAPVCGDRVHMHYIRMIRPDPGVADGMIREFSGWRDSLPRASQALSPVFIPSIGVHFNYEFALLFPEWIPRTLEFMSRQFPTPLHIYAGPHKPATNQKPDFIETQGPDRVRAFKEEVERELRSQSVEQKGERGGVRYFDTYGMTDGATSFDGAHMGYIPNMEKAHIILNLLDLWWGDIVAAGGLVQQG